MSHTPLSRQELYELVWSKPMTHIARDYGMSDNGVRKHCIKHNIPTPIAGYWAKIAHGKSVRKPPLPTKKFAADAPVSLETKNRQPRSAESELAAQQAESKRTELERILVVPENLPNKPHTHIRAIRAALRRSKPDISGFLEPVERNIPKLSIGRNSIPRILRLLNTLFTCAEQEGHTILRNDDQFYWVVQGEHFLIRVYEIRSRKRHEPTVKEHRDQAQSDKWSMGWQHDTPSNRKVYRTWDYFPSGRLTIELQDTNRTRWGEQALLKKWRDRKTNRVENRLTDIFTWLEPASVIAREKRIEIGEQDRREKEEADRKQRARKRRKQAKILETYLNELADNHAKVRKMGDLIKFLENQTTDKLSTTNQLIMESKSYKEYLTAKLCNEQISQNLEKFDITLDETLLMPALETELSSSGLSWRYG